MPACRLCGHDNPAGAERCEKCLAWLVQRADVAGVQPAPSAEVGDEALIAEVTALLSAGRKIEAIRVFRERKDVGLAEAKHAVEAIEAGRQWAAGPSEDAGDPNLAADVLQLVQDGNLIAAVKRYREATGRGLKESKEAVESIARAAGAPLPHHAGFSPVPLVILTAALLLIALAGALALALLRR